MSIHKQQFLSWLSDSISELGGSLFSTHFSKEAAKVWVWHFRCAPETGARRRREPHLLLLLTLTDGTVHWTGVPEKALHELARRLSDSPSQDPLDVGLESFHLAHTILCKFGPQDKDFILSLFLVSASMQLCY